jgi:hypothetical protein
MAREESEGLVRDLIFKILAQPIGEPGTIRGEGNSASFTLKASLGGRTCRAEGSLDYTLPCGLPLSHKWDVLIERPKERWLGLEVKRLSAVTDQFNADPTICST